MEKVKRESQMLEGLTKKHQLDWCLQLLATTMQCAMVLVFIILVVSNAMLCSVHQGP